MRTLLFISLLVIGIASCSKDEGNGSTPKEIAIVEPEIEYYVRYDVKMNMLKRKGNRKIQYKTTEGNGSVPYNFV